MFKKISLTLITLALFNTAHAAFDNNCSQLHLQITNLTKNACVLAAHSVIHGNLMTSPPMSILPNDSKRFDMMQTGFGPSITLSYLCGEETIIFNSQQNVCIMKAGNVTGTLVPPTPHDISTSYEALEGSYFWNKPGSINWKIVNVA